MTTRMSSRSFATTIALITLIAGWAGAQPEPWLHPDGTIHYYDAINAPGGINWDAAQDSSLGHGGYLATVTSQTENDFIFGLLDSGTLWHQRPGMGRLAGPWLGGAQDFGSREPDSGWHWTTDEMMDFRNWSPGQPDNGGGNENALHFGESAGVRVPTWNDANRLDDSIRGFVRELSADSTTVGLLQNDSTALPGYSLFSHRGSRSVHLIDNKGRLVHQWTNPDYGVVAQYYLLESGNLLHIDNLLNPVFWDGGRVAMLDWQSNEVWGYNYSDSVHSLHHDAIGLPNGHVLFIAFERKTRDEAIAAGRDTAKLTDNKLYPDHLVEVDPATDSIVWTWHAWDHLIQDYDSTKANYGVVADHPELIDLNWTYDNLADWLHSCALSYNAELDQVMITVQRFSEVWVIDHSTTTEQARGHNGGRYGQGGDLLYRWGNPSTYRAGDTTTQRFFLVHAGNWIAPGLPGAGHMLALNNGFGRPGGNGSSVDEVIPDCDSLGFYARPAPGAPFGPTDTYWSFKTTPPGKFYGLNMGGAQRLPNGNTLTAEGTKGRFYEVSPDSHFVWRYMNPETDSGITYQGDTVKHGPVGWESNSFRALRYTPDYPGLAGRNLTPGYPLELYRSRQVAGLAQTPSSGSACVGLTVRPNPFSRTATIQLDLPHAASTGLDIYSIDGRLIRTLPVARNQVVWDGTDNAGKPVRRGVYYCRLQGPGFGATQKIVKAE